MPNKEELLKDIESVLYRSLTQKADDFDFKKFSSEIDYKGIVKKDFDDKSIVRKELKEAQRLFKKFNHNNKPSEQFAEVFDLLKEEIGKKTKIFAYGFYHDGDETPLYIGRTGNSTTRLNQHFQMYSSAFVSFPMRFLDEIKFWRSDILTEHNIKQFESFLINSLTPHFNKQCPKEGFEKEKEAFQKLFGKSKSIQLSNYKELFKKFS
jgi:hypothetical protein